MENKDKNTSKKNSWEEVLQKFVESETYKKMDKNNKFLTYTKWLRDNYTVPKEINQQ